MLPSPVSCMKPPLRAPPFRARMALADRAPKLIAEILKTLAEYGFSRGQSGWLPISMRKSWPVTLAGAMEWLIHS